jgi:hypothetical protein
LDKEVVDTEAVDNVVDKKKELVVEIEHRYFYRAHMDQ